MAVQLKRTLSLEDRVLFHLTRRNTMHPNEIKVTSSTLELFEMAEQLGPNHVAALQEQVIRQELEKNSK
tara:strand:- start:523 stop:729 length:207 start_codon:yes stop_codon:yes gene_type:complete